MYIKDAESSFVRANRVVCDVVGAGHPDELIGHTDFDFFPPAIAAQIRRRGSTCHYDGRIII